MNTTIARILLAMMTIVNFFTEARKKKPSKLHQEHINGGNSVTEDDDDNGLGHLKTDYHLLVVLLVVLATFYMIIMWILSSADRDRAERLGKLGKKHS